MRLFSNKIQENSKIRSIFSSAQIWKSVPPPPPGAARAEEQRWEWEARNSSSLFSWTRIQFNNHDDDATVRFKQPTTIRKILRISVNKENRKMARGQQRNWKWWQTLIQAQRAGIWHPSMACAQKLSPISCITHVILPIFVSFPLTGIKSRIHTKLLSQYRLYRGVGDGRGRYWWTSYSLLPPRGSWCVRFEGRGEDPVHLDDTFVIVDLLPKPRSCGTDLHRNLSKLRKPLYAGCSSLCKNLNRRKQAT